MTNTQTKKQRNNKIRELREKGLTFQMIGNMFSISGQRVGHIVHPEYRREYRKTPKYREHQREYRRTPKYREYQRHWYHIKVNKIFNNCKKCKQ